MVLTLLTVSLLAGAVLGGGHLLTKDAIAQVKLEQTKQALANVLPPFDRTEEKVIQVDGKDLVCNYAYKNDSLVGISVKTFTAKGFSGEITMMVGFLPNFDIFNVQVLEHKETPGLGSKMNEWFGKGGGGSVLGKNLETFNLKVKRDGGQVDAITAATITSRAFCDAIQRAYNSIQTK